MFLQKFVIIIHHVKNYSNINIQNLTTLISMSAVKLYNSKFKKKDLRFCELNISNDGYHILILYLFVFL